MHRVSKVDWQQAVDDILYGKDVPPYKATAEKIGLPHRLFEQRLNQWFAPETYGHIPDAFFLESVNGRISSSSPKMSNMVYVIGTDSLPNFRKGTDPIKQMIEDAKPKKPGRKPKEKSGK